MERQELIKKIEQLPPDRLVEVEKFVDSIAGAEADRDSIHQALTEYAMKHSGADVRSMEEYRASVREIVEEVLEEAALARAIDEGRESTPVTREEIFHILDSAQ